MRICLFGGGAIGGLLATKLALAGEEVTVIDRGPNLSAITEEGLELRSPDGHVDRVRVNTVQEPAVAGRQDVLVLAVKAHSLPTIANDIVHLLDTSTVVITVQNGIPWWYFQKYRGPFEGRCLKSLDPNGLLTSTIDIDRIIGCVAYPAAIMIAPGVIQHVEGDRFPIGELDGSTSDRIQSIEAMFNKAQLRSRVLEDIRSEIWLKAIGTAAFNPISALTHATMSEICDFAETRELAIAIMGEAQEVAEKLGVALRVTIQKRLEGAKAVGAHKTSMLQDVEAGRTLELGALMGAIVEMGRLTDTRTPAIDAVYALAKLLDQRLTSEGRGLGF